MTEERHDDEVLGRALSRAIETPYERSRIADRPARRGFSLWQFAGVAAALVLALAFGSWFTRPTVTVPVAASPSTSASTTAASPIPSASASAQPQQQSVYVWRDELPPTVKLANGGDPRASIEARIAARLEALNNAVSGLPGTILLADPKQFYVRSVKIHGDTATIDYSAHFPPSGSAGDIALTQQIVYTATEEPTITRILVTENGKPMTTGHLLWNRPLTREDVSGYKSEIADGITDPGTGDVPPDQLRLSTTYSVDTFSPGLARFVIQIDRSSGTLPQGFLPKFDAVLYGASTIDQSGLRGKASLWVTVGGGDPKVGLEIVDKSPLRSVNSIRNGAGTIYQLKLDARYPWRIFALANPTRLVVDVGGTPQSVSDRIAVYSPARMEPVGGAIVGRTPPPTGSQFTLSGAARTFEASVVWRVKDSSQKIVANGHTTASLGTGAVWGTFSTQVTLPGSVTGNVTIEVFEASAKDGSELGRVVIPLTVR